MYMKKIAVEFVDSAVSLCGILKNPQ